MGKVKRIGSSAGWTGSGSGGSADETKAATPRLELSEVGAVRVGQSVGRYVVLAEVGRGGMGRVLRAYDPKLRREVALKELSGDGLNEDSRARLLAEARAMAKLSHAHVVGVHDVEQTQHGSLVLVMEYVAGRTLRSWLREGKRSHAEIVEAFIEAGRGLSAAHRAGILHRDFKPANVLVADDGAVKVTDFGLAKVAAEDSWSSSQGVSAASGDVLTEAGVVMGTPRYMAPEQHRGETLTPAADQYGLCVALWEALNDEPPFSGKDLVENKDRELPAWPNSSTPRPLVVAIRRGLSPDPSDRWPSVDALLEGLTYDSSRRRNRAVLALSGLGFAAAVGLGAQTWAAERAQRCAGAMDALEGIWDSTRRADVHAAIATNESSYAQGVWERAETVLDRYAQDWAAMHTDVCEATTIRGEQSTAVMDLRMACLHRASVELQAVVDLLADADASLVARAHKVTGGLRPLSRCADTAALSAAVEPPLPAEAEAVAEARRLLEEARAAERGGRHPLASHKVAEAKARLAGSDYGPVQTELALREASVLEGLGEFEESERRFREALQLGSASRQWDATGTAARRLIYVVGFRRRRPEEALRYRELALGIDGGDAAAEARIWNNVGSVRQGQGRYADAEAEHRRALALQQRGPGIGPLEVATTRNSLGGALYAQGKLEAAEVEFRGALAALQEGLGPDHPDVANSRDNLGTVLYAQGKHKQAEVEVRRALAVGEAAQGPEHPDVVTSINNLGLVLFAQGKFEEAEADFRKALDLRVRTLGPDHPDVSTTRNNLAAILWDRGKTDEAQVLFREALQQQEKTLGPDHPDVAATRHNLANVLASRGELDAAEVELRRAVAIQLKALGPDHPDVARARMNLADLLLQAGRPQEALPLAEQAWHKRDPADVPPQRRAETAFVLAQALWATASTPKERARAQTLAADAVQDYETAGPHLEQERQSVETWLEAHPSRAR